MINAFIVLISILVIFLVYSIFFSPTSQILGKVVFHGHGSDKKVIALTFDDGPNEPFTSQILDVLARFNVKATFFVVGENIVRNPLTIKRMTKSGHVIGNHSYSHSFLAPILSPSFKIELVKTQNLIADLTGKTPALFRPPWFFRTSSMLKSAKKLGLTNVTGTFASYSEIFQINPEKIANSAIEKIKPGTILVFHDGYNNKTVDRTKTVQALEILIPALIREGYKISSLSELAHLEPYQKNTA